MRPASISIVIFFFISRNAFDKFLGIFKFEANPFPDPIGMIANITFVFTKQDATSFIVPSPPQATIISAFSAIDSNVSTMACFAY